MAADAEALGNEAAVKAVTDIAKAWFNADGWEAHLEVEKVRMAATESKQPPPEWLAQPNRDLQQAGAFSRYILSALQDSSDDTVRRWVDDAIREARQVRAQAVDPLTLGIGGAILVVAILAARVRRIGRSLEFFEGIPKELADILKLVGPRDDIDQ